MSKIESRPGLFLSHQQKKRTRESLLDARAAVNEAVRKLDAGLDAAGEQELTKNFKADGTNMAETKEEVKRKLKLIQAELNKNDFAIVDTPVFGEGSEKGTEGYNREYQADGHTGRVHLNLRTQASYKKSHQDYGVKRRNAARVIIHETSHKVAKTEDVAYLWEKSKWTSMDNAGARKNADSYAFAALGIGGY